MIVICIEEKKNKEQYAVFTETSYYKKLIFVIIKLGTNTHTHSQDDCILLQ